VLGAIVAAITLAVSPPAPTDEELAGSRLVTGFSGHHPPAALRRLITEGRVSGVILFDRNAGTRRAVRRLTAELQSIPRPPAVDRPLLVTVDQEGGLVRRLPGPPHAAADEIGARGPAAAERVGRATGESLREMGVNVDLAPLLDLGRPGFAITEERRAFGRTPGAVSDRGVAFARGLAAAGVAATAKHFPGLGGARLNTDDARPNKPAAFSPAIATDELRERLGFQGVSITEPWARSRPGRSAGRPHGDGGSTGGRRSRPFHGSPLGRQRAVRTGPRPARGLPRPR
jgi:beta-N-acetylhexosaminidase